MALSEQQQINLFAQYKNKDEEELDKMLQSLGLSLEGDKQDKIRRLVSSEGAKQSVFEPQALAIRTGGPDSLAAKWCRKVNSVILPQDDNGNVIQNKVNRRLFTFVSRNGANYEMECPYVKMRTETAQKIIDQGWVSPLESQRKLLKVIKENPDQFEFNAIRKRDRRSQWYLMVHVSPKKAA